MAIPPKFAGQILSANAAPETKHTLELCKPRPAYDASTGEPANN